MESKILVYVEKGEDGTYWGTTQNLNGVVAAFGDTLEELKSNLTSAIKDHLEIAAELGMSMLEDNSQFELEFKIDLQGFFELIPEIKISNLAIKAGINASLLRQYKTGAANASIEQMKKLELAVHNLGEELLSITF